MSNCNNVKRNKYHNCVKCSKDAHFKCKLLKRYNQQHHEQYGNNNSQLQNNDVKKQFRHNGQQQQQQKHNPQNVEQHDQQKRKHQDDNHDKKDLQKCNNANEENSHAKRKCNVDHLEQCSDNNKKINNPQCNKCLKQNYKDDQSRRSFGSSQNHYFVDQEQNKVAANNIIPVCQKSVDDCNIGDKNHRKDHEKSSKSHQSHPPDKKQTNYKLSCQIQQDCNDKIQKEYQSNKNKLQHPSDEQNSKAPVLKPPFEMTKFSKSSSNFEAFVVDISCIEDGMFACIPYTCCRSFIDVQAFLAKMDHGGQPYKPVLNEYCVALFEGNWYRAKVIEIKETQITVECIDTATKANVEIEDIRRYPTELTLVSSTNNCKLAGLPSKLSPKLLNQLKKMIDKFQKLYVTRITRNDKICEIECPVLLKELKNLSFI